MKDIRNQQSNYVRYALKSEIDDVLWLKEEPKGWSEDQIEFVRHKDYHGILTSFTGELSFYKEAKEYIKKDFKYLGINSKLRIFRYELREVEDVIKWDLDFVGIVDYSTKSELNGELKIKFNSNELEELLKTRESDEFELERDTSIEGVQISELETHTAEISGVPISTSTIMDIIKDEDYIEAGSVSGNLTTDYWSKGEGDKQVIFIKGDSYQSPVLEMLTDTNDRISTPDSANPDADPASQMFFVDSTDENVDVNTLLSLEFSVNLNVDVRNLIGNSGRRKATLHLIRYQYDENEFEYNIVDNQILSTEHTSSNTNVFTNLSYEGSFKFNDIAWNQGLALLIRVEGSMNNLFTNFKLPFLAEVNNFSINIISKSTRQSSDSKFLFVHDALNRLTNIMTGVENRFISRVFGRIESGYDSDGEYGLIGITSGFWIRQFNKNYELYKSIKLSTKDLIDSLNAVFNTGLGIELIDGVKKIVVEDLRYFYQEKVLITLDEEINNPEYKVIKNDYFSTIEIGYNKGGDYNNSTGLDEPNVQTSWITPINRNKQKYRKISDIRADDIGMEIIRRKPAGLYPEEDTSQDDHNWFLDLKRDGTSKFKQKEWFDRLKSIPVGLSYAQEFKGFLFTPLRMLFRHSWIIRSGLEQAINLKKFITVINSKSNQTLGMIFNDDNKIRYESDDILISDLKRSITKPEEVTFTYPISNELIKKISSKTVVDYQNQKVAIPNFYFKFEWKNKEGEIERGFLRELKPSTNEITFILANDNNII